MNHSDPRAAPAAPETNPRSTKAQLRSIVDRLVDADYVADAERIGQTADAQTTIELLNQLRLIQERLDLAWVGATVARLFLKHAWLQSVDLEVSAEPSYDDAGGSFISHSLRFADPTALPNARLPDDLASADGTLDEAAAVEALAAEYEDDACDFAAPFLPSNASDATTLRLGREVMASLLGRGASVSGLDVAQRLWPDHEVVKRLAVQSGS